MQFSRTKRPREKACVSCQTDKITACPLRFGSCWYWNTCFGIGRFQPYPSAVYQGELWDNPHSAIRLELCLVLADKLEYGPVKYLRLLPVSGVSRIGHNHRLGISDSGCVKALQRRRRGQVRTP